MASEMVVGVGQGRREVSRTQHEGCSPGGVGVGVAERKTRRGVQQHSAFYKIPLPL